MKAGKLFLDNKKTKKQKKIAKNIGVLHRAKYFPNESLLKCIYSANIHSYLNYANIVWAGTYWTKLKAIDLFQKRAVRIIFNENNITPSRPLLRRLNALNVYQINLFQYIRFKCNFNKNKTPIIFNNLIKKPFHKYAAKYSKNSFTLKNFLLSSSKYCISFQGPKVWDDFLANEEEEINPYLFFQKLLNLS